MKATTFVLRQQARIREKLAVLANERHVRMQLLGEVIEELLFFLTAEEDLFYPALPRDDAAVGGEMTRLQGALLDLMSADERSFGERLRALDIAAADHARTDERLVRIAEAQLGEEELQRIGARMSRFWRDSVGAAHGQPDRPSLAAH